jgi:hypothetical protein
MFCAALIARAGIADDEFVAISGIKDYLYRISGAGLDWHGLARLSALVLSAFLISTEVQRCCQCFEFPRFMPSGTCQMTKVGNCQEISTKRKVFSQSLRESFFDFNQDKWGETKRHS